MPNPQCGRIASETKGNKQVSVMLFSVFRTCPMSITPCARMWKDRGGSGLKRKSRAAKPSRYTTIISASNNPSKRCDGEQGLELVWGMGMVRWRIEDGRIGIDHPVVEQLADIDMDTLSGRINIRPRSTEPNVPLKPFVHCAAAIENPGADQVHSFAKDFFTRFKEDEDLSPFNGETVRHQNKWDC